MRSIAATHRRGVRRCSAAVLLLCVPVLMTFSSCDGTPDATSTTEAIRAEILEFIHEWNTAIASQDRDAVRAAYSEDSRFRWFEDGALRFESVEDILNAIDRFPPGTRVHTEVSDVTINPLSDRLVYGSVAFQTRLMMPGNDFEFGGVFTMLVERKDTGWVFVCGHTSTRRPDAGRRGQ